VSKRIYIAALVALFIVPKFAEAGPLRTIGRGLKAVAGKVVHGAGRVVRGVGRGLRGGCGG